MRSDQSCEHTLQNVRGADVIISRCYVLASHESSIVTNDTCRSTNFYDIKRDNANEIEKQGSWVLSARDSVRISFPSSAHSRVAGSIAKSGNLVIQCSSCPILHRSSFNIKLAPPISGRPFLRQALMMLICSPHDEAQTASQDSRSRAIAAFDFDDFANSKNSTFLDPNAQERHGNVGELADCSCHYRCGCKGCLIGRRWCRERRSR